MKAMKVMNNNQEIKALADNLWVYFEPKIKAMLSSGVSFYRAQITAAAANNRITVQRPFDDTEISLPYVSSAAELPVGSQVTVLVLGSPSNAIVLGSGTLGNL